MIRVVTAALLIVALMAAQATELDIMKNIQDDRVTIELLFESQCPFCRIFMAEQLSPVLALPGIWDIADIRLIPYGNANFTKKGKYIDFTCQHGETECQGNIIYSCALNLYNQQTVGIPFVLCVDASMMNWNDEKTQYQTSGAICAERTGADWNKIKECTNSFYGREWLYEYGLRTKQVKINHVPYMLVNGYFDAQNERSNMGDLLGVICRNYQGNKQKSYCSNLRAQNYY